MKILKILGIAAGLHALALLLIFANPGCSSTKAAQADTSPISSAPADTGPAPAVTAPDSVGIRYSPTRPGTSVAAALESEPVSDVTPASTYTIEKGDSLSSIAKKNQLTKAELAAANHLKTSAVLHVGQKLIIPSKAAQAPAPAAAASASAPAPTAAAEAASGDKGPTTEATKHVVKAGETLGGIARKYGVRQGDIAVANNITDPRKIQPGQELVIPAHSASKQAKAAKTSDAAKAPAADQDLDAGLKPAGAAEIPTVKIDDSAPAPQPNNP
jgi:LysM repeat protein